MYYSQEEISEALDRASEIINYRINKKGFVFGYSDCYCLLVEYDRLLRGKTNADNILDYEYNNSKEFLLGLKNKKLNLKTFAKACNYKLQTKPRPMFGDIAYMEGGAVIAGKSHWVSVSDRHPLGVSQSLQYTYFERRLKLLARPYRS